MILSFQSGITSNVSTLGIGRVCHSLLLPFFPSFSVFMLPLFFLLLQNCFWKRVLVLLAVLGYFNFLWSLILTDETHMSSVVLLLKLHTNSFACILLNWYLLSVTYQHNVILFIEPFYHRLTMKTLLSCYRFAKTRKLIHLKDMAPWSTQAALLSYAWFPKVTMGGS